ncbi:MAG: hypothetical protein KGM97_02495, partial [Alphaproteobacteria bacterium]|nr:hypothetical protein [Alphaproteobacteria bacterium]
AAASSEQTADLDQVVCKRLPPLVGSRLGGRTECQTKKQWLALEKDTQDVLSKLQNGANQPTGPGK